MKKTILVCTMLVASIAKADDYVKIDVSMKPIEATFIPGAKTIIISGVSACGYWLNGKYKKYKTAMEIAETAKQLANARKARALARKKSVKQRSSYSKFKKGFEFTLRRKVKNGK